MPYVCRICHLSFPVTQDHAFVEHVGRCYARNSDLVDGYRTAAPFEGDPELAAFARQEGDVYNRRAGTRRQPH
jgi:hypothetical protein